MFATADQLDALVESIADAPSVIGTVRPGDSDRVA